MTDERLRGIYVLAGTNGAGKSSILGRDIVDVGSTFLNPDELTRQLLERDPVLSTDAANSQAWFEMVRLLRIAIDDDLSFPFETTLGGQTITGELLRGASLGRTIRVAYVGLASAELHIARVRKRVQAGGHSVREEQIRARYDGSRQNIIRLIPELSELWLFDNSEESESAPAEPQHLLHMADGRVVSCCEPDDIPAWAKPIIATALRVDSESE